MASVSQSRQLTEMILDSGIQNTNYFNGRILAAGDLQTDQDANRQQHEQLGLALGAGVVQGLWVELVNDGSGGTPPVVSVTHGLALNANGQAVALPIDVQVALARQTTPAAADAGLFTDCAPPSSTTVPLQAGLYVLVMSPASGFSGRAPMFGFGDVTAATGCGSRYAVEGVRFRLVQLNIDALSGLSQTTRTAIDSLLTQTDAASRSKLRNWVAHVCFGTEEAANFVADPFATVTVSNTSGTGSTAMSAYNSYGAIDALLASGDLTSGDVPLALLQWTLLGVQYLDVWSVRRRAVPAPLSTSWPLPFSLRRRSEVEATFLQFQCHVQSLLDSSLSDAAVAAVQATAWFRYLPAAAPLPVSRGTERAFGWRQFFGGVTIGLPWFVEGAKLSAILARSLPYAPIDPGNQELVRVYFIRQNIQAIDNAAGAAPQQYIVFASGQMPFEGKARFDLNRWGYANFY